ncbi:MAG TPA: hypothetical protein VJ914_20800 [Pseudonocardiaceae bacterium]|nr:hypothetical protein [Pseudonocardiaceae bacterium]
MTDLRDLEPAEDEPTGADRYKHLPDHVRLEDTISSQPTDVDQETGVDGETNFMLRYD